MAAVPSIGRATGVTAPSAAPEADATRALYERYHQQIFSFCLHQLGNREEAEDAVQGTFLNAFRGLKRGIEPQHESAWLFKIAANVCLTRRRASFRRGRVEWAADLQEYQDMIPGAARQTDELWGLNEALAAMPEQQRTAILLREWQGLSYKEIAQDMGLTQGAVETLIFRARRTLAQGLEQPEGKKRGRIRRLSSAIDFGGILAGLKTFLGGSAAVKVAVTAAVATTATSTVVATQTHVLQKPKRAPKPAPAQVQKKTSLPVQATRHTGASIAAVPTTAHSKPVVVPDAKAAADVPARAEARTPKSVAHHAPRTSRAPIVPEVDTPAAAAESPAPAAAAAPTASAPEVQHAAPTESKPAEEAKAEQPKSEPRKENKAEAKSDEPRGQAKKDEREARAQQPKGEQPKAERPVETPAATGKDARGDDKPKGEEKKAETPVPVPAAPSSDDRSRGNGNDKSKGEEKKAEAAAPEVPLVQSSDDRSHANGNDRPRGEDRKADAPAPLAVSQERIEDRSPGNGNGNDKPKGEDKKAEPAQAVAQATPAPPAAAPILAQPVASPPSAPAVEQPRGSGSDEPRKDDRGEGRGRGRGK